MLASYKFVHLTLQCTKQHFRTSVHHAEVRNKDTAAHICTTWHNTAAEALTCWFVLPSRDFQYKVLPFKEPFLLTNSTDSVWPAQAFGPDLALIDFVLAGGGALADKLGIPKAINCITGLLPPVVEHAYGSGASLLSSVPQWMSLAPRKMVSSKRTGLAHRQ